MQLTLLYSFIYRMGWREGSRGRNALCNIVCKLKVVQLKYKMHTMSLLYSNAICLALIDRDTQVDRFKYQKCRRHAPFFVCRQQLHSMTTGRSFLEGIIMLVRQKSRQHRQRIRNIELW